METKIPEFNATSACERCGGRCCKHMGCHFSPSDFKEISFEALKAKIEEGYISIDWWEGEDACEYYLRMRHKNAPIVDPSWGGECILLTETGCSLPFEERPLGARSLEPRRGFESCTVHYDKRSCVDDWLPYDDILRKLVKYFEK